MTPKHGEKKGLKDEGSRTQVLLAGAIAGLVARFIIAPLDVVKIRLQLQTHPPRLPTTASPPTTTTTTTIPPPSHTQTSTQPLYTTTLSTLRRIYTNEGLPALWKGNIPASYLYITYSALQFTFYTSTSTLLHSLTTSLQLPPPSKSADSFISGATAGAGATICTYPLDLLRTRFAAQGNTRVYTGILAGVRTIYRDEGPRGFFRGSSAAVAQIVPYMGTFFLLYESLRPVLSDQHGSFSVASLPFGSGDAVSGVIASILSKTLVFPLDLVRKRLQVQGPTRGLYEGGVGEYRGVIGGLRKVIREDGVRGCYRGLSVSLWKAAPASAVTMWVYERSLKGLMTLSKKESLTEL